MYGVPGGPVIALIDGEHHPSVSREALDRLDAERGIAGVVFCGGEEKLAPGSLERAEEVWGRVVETGDEPAAGLTKLAAETNAVAVVDLADEPVLPAQGKLRLAAYALHAGLAYETPGDTLRPPRYERVAFEGPTLAVIGTGKRTGKTSVAGHLAYTLRTERDVGPAIVSMGRGGPAEPQIAHADLTLDDLLALAGEGRHAASDYLEDAVLAGVLAIGCRRIGAGLAGEPAWSNVPAGAALAASLRPGALIFEGSGACVPPVEADRTICIVGDRAGALEALGPYRLLRADLALTMDASDEALAADIAAIAPGRTVRCELRPHAAEQIPDDARVALFTTGADHCEGVSPVVASQNLARRSELAADLDTAERERCDVYLIEVKAAAIDTVAMRARENGARVVFLRNRPVARDPDEDLDAILLSLYDEAARG